MRDIPADNQKKRAAVLPASAFTHTDHDIAVIALHLGSVSIGHLVVHDGEHCNNYLVDNETRRTISEGDVTILNFHGTTCSRNGHSSLATTD